MLITVHGRLVRSHGSNDRPLPGAGAIQYQPATHGTHEGALRGVDPVTARIVDGEADDVELTPGPWRVSVFPEYGAAWEPWIVELTEDMDEPVELADLAPVLVIDGEKWATGPQGGSVVGVRDNGDQTVTWIFSDGTESEPVEIAVGPQGDQGDEGDQGASVTGAVDHGDGTLSFTLSDGRTTDPVVMPPGPAGRGITEISDPDEDSVVTITYSDGSTSEVQAIRGAQGDTGPTPEVEWDGASLIVDGEASEDLTGPAGPANSLTVGTVETGDEPAAEITGDAPEQVLNLTLARGKPGKDGDTGPAPEITWDGSVIVVDDAEGPDLRGPSGIASVSSPADGVWMIDQATDGDEDRLKDLQEAVYDKVARWELDNLADTVDALSERVDATETTLSALEDIIDGLDEWVDLSCADGIVPAAHGASPQILRLGPLRFLRGRVSQGSGEDFVAGRSVSLVNIESHDRPAEAVGGLTQVASFASPGFARMELTGAAVSASPSRSTGWFGLDGNFWAVN